MEEIWKDVEGYEGLYQVSNEGRVKSLDRRVAARNDSTMFKKGVLMTLQTTHKGYYGVVLQKEGVKRTHQVHRLVATAFIPNLEGKTQVNHIDCNKKNNHVSNLEWVTQNENMQHAVDNGRFLNFSEKQRCSVIKNLESAVAKRKRSVEQYSLDGKLIRTFGSITDAEKATGASCPKITDCCRGKRKTTHGFIWKYAKEEMK